MLFAQIFGRPRSIARSVLFCAHRYRWEFLCAIVATIGLAAATNRFTPPSPPPTAMVTVTDLPAGHTITARDVVNITVPPDALGDVATAAEVIGARAPRAISAHTVLTEAQLKATYPAVEPGQAVVAVPVSAGAELPQLRSGDTVELVFGAEIAAMTSTKNASQVSYRATVIHPPHNKTTSTGGLLTGNTSATGHLVLAADKSSARNIATFATRVLPGVVLIP